MSNIYSSKLGYSSSSLTPEKRAELTEALAESKRTTYYDLTPEQVGDRNEWTLENMEIGVCVLDWDEAIKRLGLVVVKPEVEYELDDNGEQLMDEKGNPVVKSRKIADHDFMHTVEVEGLVDAEGNDIPPSKTKVAFRVGHQATNRPRNETNWQSVVERMAKWGVNGEPLIKDANGCGISEQHRAIAKVSRVLSGKDQPTDRNVITVFVNGIHPDVAVTVDTGKSNSGKDIFGSDPELVPPTLLQLPMSLLGETDGPVYMEDRTKERTRVCGACESATKLVMLRMGAKNVNGSLGNGQLATENAHKLVTKVLPDMDDLATVVHSFLQSMDSKLRPCSSSELTAALALHFLRDEEHIDTVPRKGFDGGRPVDECDPIRFEIKSIYPLLQQIAGSPQGGPLSEWALARKGAVHGKANKQTKFAQTCLMIDKFLEGDEITTDDLTQKAIGGPQNATKFYNFGGADRGPVPKKAKAEADE